MKVVLDTNVVLSAIFWSGTPGKILELWSRGRFQLLLSLKVFEEYREINTRLSKKYALPSGADVLNEIFMGAHFVEPENIQTPHCDDPDDIMFLKQAELTIWSQAITICSR